MKKWLRISLISCALTVVHYLYLYPALETVSFYDLFCFLFSDMVFCEAAGFGRFSLFRNAAIILLLIWWLMEMMQNIAETSRYASMVIHRYVSVAAYFKYLLSIYSKKILFLLTVHLLCCGIVYLVMSGLCGRSPDFSALFLVLPHYGKLFFFYLLLVCFIHLFDLMNRGQIAYIAGSLLIVLYVFSEIAGVHTALLFYAEDVALTFVYILFFTACLALLYRFYKACIERKDIL